MLKFLVQEGYGGSSASPGSGSNEFALEGPGLKVDQAVEEAGPLVAPLPRLSDHGFVNACRKVRTLRPNVSPAELGRRASRPGLKCSMASNSQKATKHRALTPRPNAGSHHGSSRPRARAHLCRASP